MYLRSGLHPEGCMKCGSLWERMWNLRCQGDQNETLDRNICICASGGWLRRREHGTGWRRRLLSIRRLSRWLQRKSGRRFAPAAGRTRGGDPRRRCPGNAYESRRSGESRRPALIRSFARGQHARGSRIARGRDEADMVPIEDCARVRSEAGAEYNPRLRLQRLPPRGGFVAALWTKGAREEPRRTDRI